MRLYRSAPILFPILIITITLSALSQGGSNYSIYGIGDALIGNSAATFGAGGLQIGTASDNNISVLNPALWSKVKTTRIQTGFKFNQNIISNSSAELWQNNSGLNGFYSIFNIDSEREIGIGLMLHPISAVNYHIVSDIIDISGESIGTNRYIGSGGLNSFSIGVGGRVIDGVYIGGSLSGNFGKIERNSETSYRSVYSLDYQVNQLSVFNGIGYSFGAYFSPISALGIGLFYNISGKTRDIVEHHYKYYPQTVLNRDTVVTVRDYVTLPDYYGIGISYRLGRFLYNVDWLGGNFSRLEVNRNGSSGFNNLSRYGLGITLLGNDNPFASLRSKISYRVGGYYEDLYYSIGGVGISEYGVTFGVYLPISRMSNIDLGFSFGSRGDLGVGLLRERFGRMMIDISIGDIWFKPLRFDD